MYKKRYTREDLSAPRFCLSIFEGLSYKRDSCDTGNANISFKRVPVGGDRPARATAGQILMLECLSTAVAVVVCDSLGWFR